jgi:ABC-2 type transport system permease protein
MNRFAWLVRRELWEHRAIWLAPAVVLGLLVLVAATGQMHLGEMNFGSAQEIEEMSPEQRERLERELQKEFGDEAPQVMARIEAGHTGTLLTMLPQEKQVALVLVIYAMLTVLMFVVLGTIAFFYALDSLYADRRDRSVLFWKSLPLSDAETVLSKYFVVIVAIPLVAALASVAAQLIVATGGSIKLALAGDPAGLMWNRTALLGGLGAATLMPLATALWYAPVAAYLLLASAWAPKSPFLWAVLPPAAGVVLERIAFGSDYIGNFLVSRLLGLFKAIADDESGTPGIVVQSRNLPETANMLISRLADTLLSPAMLLGLVAAAAMIAAAIWVRRYRDETI